MMKARSTMESIFRGAVYRIVLLAVLFIFIFPFIYMVLGAFKNTVDIVNPEKLFSFKPTMRNFISLFERYRFAGPLKNSLIISGSATLLSLIVGLPASYSIACYRIRSLQSISLLVRVIPTIAFLVPVYLMFSKLGMVGTYRGIILTHMLIGVPFTVWVMIPYFQNIPKELRESALIDGASQYKVFGEIMIPLSVPAIMTVSVLTFINSWNNFMFGMILGNARTRVLPTLIFNFLSHAEINYAGLMAGASLVTLPVIIISICLQKYVVQGLTAGAVKG